MALLAVSSPTVAGAGPRQDRDALAYRELVGRYRAGDVDGATRLVASWKGRRLLDTVRRIRQRYDRGRGIPEWDVGTIAAACLLHLELLRSQPDDRAAANLHLLVLREHLESLRSSHPPSPLAADLHWALALYLQATLRLEDLGLHFEEIGDSFRSDGRLLLAEGTLHETLASHRLEGARKAALVPSEKSSLESAAGFLRAAAAVGPNRDEARLRLAHVLILQGRTAAGRELLEAVLADSTAPPTRYLAHMFMGQARATEDRAVDAARSFGAARDELPCAQSAAVALAHLAILEGRRADANAILDLTLHGARCEDPWALYDFGQAPELDGLIDALRRRVAAR
jgi:hypothetical protein